MAENLTDRQAAEAVRDRLSWAYALGLELTDTGFDFTVLSQFRTRVVEHHLKEKVLDLLLERLTEQGLVGAGGKQRTDSTHIVSAVRGLNRLELAGESVRAAVEALTVAAPHWVAGVLDVPGWSHRYDTRIDTWRMPSSTTKRDQLALTYARNGFALLSAVYSALRTLAARAARGADPAHRAAAELHPHRRTRRSRGGGPPDQDRGGR
ncbi:transposase [Streptomyces sp. NBC_00289]|uniref:transposase n=1 Tax=Streptomyces sp. NBC_00289 TaxID=2975703 RepID=UPI00324656B2